MHVGKALRVRVTITKCRTQFLQRIRPQSREHQEAADFQHAMTLGQGGNGIVEPVQQQVGPCQRGGTGCQRQMGSISRQTQGIAFPAQTQPTLPASPFRAPCGQHGRRQIDADQISFWVALTQRRETAATAATEVENALWLEIDVIQPLQHAVVDFPGEKIVLAVGGCYPGKTSTDLLSIDEASAQIAFIPRLANKASSRSISGLPVVSRKSP